MSDYITRLINGKQVQLATLMTGACFLADNSILMKRFYGIYWKGLASEVCADIQSVAGSASDNIVHGGGEIRAKGRQTLCNSAELEFRISELFHDENQICRGGEY